MTGVEPRPGDVVAWSDGTYGRIWEVGDGFAGPDEVHVCEELGSAFLRTREGPSLEEVPEGQVSISGGPFKVVKRADLEHTGRTYRARFWNWGDNTPGPGQGVTFHQDRPVWRYIPEYETSATRHRKHGWSPGPYKRGPS